MSTGIETIFQLVKTGMDRYLRGNAGLRKATRDIQTGVTDLFRFLSPNTVFFTDTAPLAAANGLIKTAIATSTTPVEYKGIDLNGTIGDGFMDPPRQITVTTAGGTPANAPATVLIKGKDARDLPITETVNISQSANTVTSQKFFAKVDSLSMPAGEGTAATVAFGVGAKLGLGVPPILRYGRTAPTEEYVDGVAAEDAGTLEDASTAPPYGAYAPNAANAANGTHQYEVRYELDADALLGFFPSFGWNYGLPFEDGGPCLWCHRLLLGGRVGFSVVLVLEPGDRDEVEQTLLGGGQGLLCDPLGKNLRRQGRVPVLLFLYLGKQGFGPGPEVRFKQTCRHARTPSARGTVCAGLEVLWSARLCCSRRAASRGRVAASRRPGPSVRCLGPVCALCGPRTPGGTCPAVERPQAAP